jgi:ABC-type phosphate transport system substrate-binding protein
MKSFVVLILAIVMARAAQCAEGDVAIVVRKDVPVENLTLSEVRKLFMGDRQFWNSNMRVTLLIRAPEARERTVVLKKIYQMSEAQFRQYWVSKIFRADSATGPKFVYSNEMAAELVSAIPGAVAFAEPARVPPGLKVLRVDGRLPGEKAYPLQ